MKLGDKAKEILKGVAPALATALGGPAAGAAAAAIVRMFPGERPEDVETAIIAQNPEALAKLREAEYAFVLERERIHAGDRDSARKREIAVRDWVPGVLACVVTLGFFGVLAFMLRYPVPEAGREALLVMLGALGAAFGAVIQYYYGSSAGSRAKTDELAAIAKR